MAFQMMGGHNRCHRCYADRGCRHCCYLEREGVFAAEHWRIFSFTRLVSLLQVLFGEVLLLMKYYSVCLSFLLRVYVSESFSFS